MSPDLDALSVCLHRVSRQQAHLGSEAVHAALAVSGALLHLCVQYVVWDDCEVGQLPVHLPLQLHGEPGGEPQS